MKQQDLYLDIKNASKEIKTIILNCKIKNIEVNDAKFHHSTSYRLVTNILKHGILSFERQCKLKGSFCNTTQAIFFNDENHINGTNQISVSTLDVDMSKMHDYEIMYEFASSRNVDIVISSSLKCCRNTKNYYNEFLADDIITKDNFKAIDVRILNFIDANINSYIGLNEENKAELIVEMYNYLKTIANTMIEENINIPLREMSYSPITLDPYKISDAPKILIKK